MTDTKWQMLKFQPWNSAPDVSFWQTLASLKLDKFQLDDQAQKITGYFTPGRSVDVPARFTIDKSSFRQAETPFENHSDLDRARYEWHAPGLLYNTNTLEAFKKLDKTKILNDAGARILNLVLHTTDLSIEYLNHFVLLTFADLKNHSFVYWFGFPALSPITSFQYHLPALPVASVFSKTEQGTILQHLLNLREYNQETQAHTSSFPSFFIVERRIQSPQSSTIHVVPVKTWTPHDTSTTHLNTFFGFIDPCPLTTNPGWPLRNYLAYLTAKTNLDLSHPLQILSFREHMPPFKTIPHDYEWTNSLVFQVQSTNSFMANNRSRESVKIVGWESNLRGQLGPREMQLQRFLDPIRLMETSVDLNLKLMRWRQVPSLNLNILAQTKCLLLGAGTLGCYTARSLLSWGFRHITLVDQSIVSYSNPIRQPLFEFQDIGKPKAICAANALQRIYPLVNAHGVVLTIPMAGHASTNLHDMSTTLKTLQDLITMHDIVFLGTDSRESRWLPTVIAASTKTLVVNTALGFDSYVVMRHGVYTDLNQIALGCYFCNDIVSPRDSLTDRTLDQMCTVTRPGLAPIAAALAVELVVAVLHAPEGKYVNAMKPNEPMAPMAFIPHQLRGFLNAFHHISITGEAFAQCIACSRLVVQAYETNAMELLSHACNTTAYLEKLTGVQDLTNQVDAMTFEVEDSEEDEEMM